MAKIPFSASGSFIAILLPAVAFVKTPENGNASITNAPALSAILSAKVSGVNDGSIKCKNSKTSYNLFFICSLAGVKSMSGFISLNLPSIIMFCMGKRFGEVKYEKSIILSAISNNLLFAPCVKAITKSVSAFG